MKNNPTLHDELELNNSKTGSKEAMSQRFKLGLDVDLRNVAVAVQFGEGAIGLAQKFSSATHRLGEAKGDQGLRGAHGL
jgi:hypothetical protein